MNKYFTIMVSEIESEFDVYGSDFDAENSHDSTSMIRHQVCIFGRIILIFDGDTHRLINNNADHIGDGQCSQID